MTEQEIFLCPDCGVEMKLHSGGVVDDLTFWDCKKCDLWTLSRSPKSSFYDKSGRRFELTKWEGRGVIKMEINVRGSSFEECLRKLKLGAFE